MLGYVCIEESFDTIFNMGYGSYIFLQKSIIFLKNIYFEQKDAQNGQFLSSRIL